MEISGRVEMLSQDNIPTSERYLLVSLVCSDSLRLESGEMASMGNPDLYGVMLGLIEALESPILCPKVSM